MSKFSKRSNAGPTQRQLRVGEELRHALSGIFLRGDSGEPEIDDARLTVSEVRISPDLKNATAYVMPLAGSRKEEVHALLQEKSGALRRAISGKVHLKFMPRLQFKIDHSYEVADHIDRLMRSPKVVQDITASDDEE